MNRELDLAEAVGGGDANGVGSGGSEAPAHCTNTQDGSSDPQDSPDPLEIWKTGL